MAQTDSGALTHHDAQQLQQQPEARALEHGASVAPASPQRSPTGFKKTFYKRKLPTPPAIEFSSSDGRQIFQEALMDGTMVGFFKLMEQFNTQDEPAFCGLASLAMVLNALSIDPRRTWKGSWRWFHEAMLDCCRSLDQVKEEGITLYQAFCLARCNGARVELRPYGSNSIEQFRAEVEAICRSGEEHIVVSYSRKPFLQTGDGHFSPIGGYHRGKDLVLVLDVARFKYPPHWVPLKLLYHAMSYMDPVTGRPRGYMRMASNPLLDSVLLTLDVRSDAWKPADDFLRLRAPGFVKALAEQGGLSGEDVVRRLVDAMPLASLDAFLVARSGAPLAATATAAATAAAERIAAALKDSDGTCGSGVGTGTSTAARAAETSSCGSPEILAAAVRRASKVGNAAAADAADATASSFASSSDVGSSTPAAVIAPRRRHSKGPSHHAEDFAQELISKKHSARDDTAALSKSCASGSCGSGIDCGSSTGSGGGGAAASSYGSTSSTSTNSSLMAAATAVFTAQDRCIPQGQRQQLLDELRVMPLYSLVANHLADVAARVGGDRQGLALASAPAAALTSASESGSGLGSVRQSPKRPSTLQRQQRADWLAEKVVMALLMLKVGVWPAQQSWRDPAAGAQWHALMGLGGYSVVEAEAAYLREQLEHIDEVLQSGDIEGNCGEHSSRLDCAAHGH